MRKLLTSLISVILAAVLITSAGCGLVSVDKDKDANQVVATICIEEGAPVENIYKRDILLAYLNYGYYYEQQGTYDRQGVIDFIVRNLIEERVTVQNAMAVFAADQGEFAGNIVDPSKDKWDVSRYITEEEDVDAVYSAKKAMNDLIDNYMEEEDEKVGDTYTETVRTTPTGAANAEEEELTLDQKKEYTIDADSSSERRKAVNSVISLLDANSLLGSYKNSLEETDYYKSTLKAYREQALIVKYQKCIEDTVHSQYTLDSVKALFDEKFQAQEKWTDSEYVSALSSASYSSPILYAPTGTYGFVYNLLLGASEEQTAEISDWKKENPNASNAELDAKRKEVLDKTVIKDLRSSWIVSGYDFDYQTSTFTGDYTFTSKENSLPFGGTVAHLNAGDENLEDYKAEYNVSSVKEYTVSEFVALMENYVYGKEVKDNSGIEDSVVYKAHESDKALDEYDERINELLFAFSTDSGSLNTYKGYAVKPIPDGANQEEYVINFANYGRKLLSMGDKSYIMVATDYGYHVMFYSEVYSGGAVYNNLEAYLNGECADCLDDGQTWAEYFVDMQENWSEFEDTENYLYVLYNELVSNKITIEIQKSKTNMLNKYVYGENSKVVKYPDRYADLTNS